MSDVNSQDDEKLRELAYKLWEDAGRPEGRHNEFWQAAEVQLGETHSGASQVEAQPNGAPPKAARQIDGPQDVAKPAKAKRKVPNDDVDAAGEDSFPASDPVNHT